MDLVYHQFRGFENVTDRIQKTSLMMGLIRRSMALPRQMLLEMARSIPFVGARAQIIREIEKKAREAETVSDYNNVSNISNDEISDNRSESDTTDSWTSSSGGYTSTTACSAVTADVFTGDAAFAGGFTTATTACSAVTADVFTGDAAFAGGFTTATTACSAADGDSDETGSSTSSSSRNATFSTSSIVSEEAEKPDGLIRSLMVRIEALEDIVFLRR